MRWVGGEDSPPLSSPIPPPFTWSLASIKCHCGRAFFAASRAASFTCMVRRVNTWEAAAVAEVEEAMGLVWVVCDDAFAFFFGLGWGRRRMEGPGVGCAENGGVMYVSVEVQA